MNTTYIDQIHLLPPFPNSSRTLICNSVSRLFYYLLFINFLSPVIPAEMYITVWPPTGTWAPTSSHVSKGEWVSWHHRPSIVNSSSDRDSFLGASLILAGILIGLILPLWVCVCNVPATPRSQYSIGHPPPLLHSFAHLSSKFPERTRVNTDDPSTPEHSTLEHYYKSSLINGEYSSNFHTYVSYFLPLF